VRDNSTKRFICELGKVVQLVKGKDGIDRALEKHDPNQSGIGTETSAISAPDTESGIDEVESIPVPVEQETSEMCSSAG